MADALNATFKIASHGLEAQSRRLRVVSENLANAQSTGRTAGSDPYRRKTIAFEAEMDRASGAALVTAERTGVDRAPFQRVYDPNHPAADADGYVKMPNVNMLVELADMREANRSYEANLEVIKQARSMTLRIIDLMRSGS